MSDLSEAPIAATRTPIVAGDGQNFSFLAGVALRLSVEVGSASVTLADLLDLTEGSVIELDRQIEDLLDIYANGTLVAKGEIVQTDGRYGIRVVAIAAPEQRLGGVERRS